ncbi:efflux RND transporter periplasmic adaptor subunit [Pelosinus sp. IPA-1]|uniref:efflux RND transporter periplasmic adaptor subunit n=1 Tax=Pelosinus sp. IPA-1 TaxID=3029569 RepID=UPI00243614D4|nr:efflux RND transporter periplasmic adaptor subunit [Pelosinus sp. IPA-1]GMB01978.1 hemolysin secretion protein D [Pelosinus sp. IPA-1]
MSNEFSVGFRHWKRFSPARSGHCSNETGHRFVLVAVIGLLSLVLTACNGKVQTDPRTQAPLVRVATVQNAVSAPRSFTGIVAARVQSDLGFRVSGKVLERLVDIGQTVRRGQPIMRIDPTDLGLAMQAQEEGAAAIRARVRQTAEDEVRYRALLATGAVPASTYDQMKAAADEAKAQLGGATAQAELARNASGYAVLSADADGVVVETLAEPGQVVSAGQVVVRVAHAGQREAVIRLPETLRPAVGSVGRAVLYGKEELIVPVRLRQLSKAADQLTRTFEARYVLEDALADAPLGATVTIQLAQDQALPQTDLQVPVGALFDAGKGPGVWVFDGDSARVNWRPVKIRSLDNEAVRVTGDFNTGDRVVALGAHLLHEGDLVRVAEEKGTNPVPRSGGQL